MQGVSPWKVPEQKLSTSRTAKVLLVPKGMSIWLIYLYNTLNLTFFTVHHHTC